MKNRPKSGSLGIIPNKSSHSPRNAKEKKHIFSTLFGSSKRKSVNVLTSNDEKDKEHIKKARSSMKIEELSPSLPNQNGVDSLERPKSTPFPHQSQLSNSSSLKSSPIQTHTPTAFERIKQENKGISISKTKAIPLIKPPKEVKLIEEGKILTKEDLNETYMVYLQSLPEEELNGLIANIPMRLTPKERGYLEILECALDVSEYTNNVDVAKSDIQYYGYSYNPGDVGLNKSMKIQVIEEEHKELKRIMMGLLLANNFIEGSRVLKNKEKKEEFLQNCFEVGRRYKAANPSMMRDTYQKMMHILQDAINYNPKFIGKKFEKTKQFKPIYTVEMAMKEKGMKLKELMKCIRLNEEEGLTESEIEKKYGDLGLRVVYSIRDGIEASAKSCGVVFGMLKQLERFKEEKKNLSLAIRFGVDGSKLTQNHEDHYYFVQQSLKLWWNAMKYMPLLWLMNDRDFLSGNPYKLVNTGQGLQRLQDCPNVSSIMHKILEITKKTMCEGKVWRGLSVIHLGDRDVPNSLFFIDKYSQIPWILAPVLKTVKRMFNHKELKRLPVYFELISSRSWGRAILRHFFQQGFNGSGSDGGSCIDGRLTSCWNWCSMIEKYSYYPLFLLTDFEGFEGPYKK